MAHIADDTLAASPNAPRLERATFTTSRSMDFFSQKELTTQVGSAVDDWPIVVLKELVDNALDACEDAGVVPVIRVVVNDEGITVIDNGPGIPAETVTGAIDFSVRGSKPLMASHAGVLGHTPVTGTPAGKGHAGSTGGTCRPRALHPQRCSDFGPRRG